jgi:hypothetical protein
MEGPFYIRMSQARTSLPLLDDELRVLQFESIEEAQVVITEKQSKFSPKVKLEVRRMEEDFHAR